MANRYLIVSDLHLCDAEEHPDGWMAHKSSAYIFDAEFDLLVRDFMSKVRAKDEVMLVLNGDIFDFDLVTATPEHPPWEVSRQEKKRGLRPTAKKSAWKLQHILQDHPKFMDTLAHFLLAGHRIVYVMGNHDREFHFEAVRRTFLRELKASAKRQDGKIEKEAVRFEPWFFYVPGELYVEHGQQFDYYTSFRYLLDPTIKKGGEKVISLPMGNLSNRYLMSNMGYFNPFATDYILNVFRYVAHWFKYYALTKRSLVFNWFLGSLSVMAKLLENKGLMLKPPRGYKRRLKDTAERYGLTLEHVENLRRMHKLPITNRFYRIVREFWLDRLGIAFFMLLVAVILALVPIPLWIKLMVPFSTFPLLFFIYEYLAQGESVFSVEHELPKYARKVADTLPVRLISFGHTHQPRLIPLARGVTFIDSGTWAPIMSKAREDLPEQGYRNYIYASFSKNRHEIKFDSWVPQERQSQLNGDHSGEER